MENKTNKKVFTKIRKWAQEKGYTIEEHSKSISVKVNKKLSFTIENRESTIYRSIRGIKGNPKGIYLTEFSQRFKSCGFSMHYKSQKNIIDRMEEVIEQELKREQEEMAKQENRNEVTPNEISAIKVEKYYGKVKVRRIGDGVYKVFGFSYGEQEELHTGFADDTSKYINWYLRNFAQEEKKMRKPDEYVLVNGQNYFNEESLNEMIEQLEAGKMIMIHIDCIGHTRTAYETAIYVEELRNRFGDRLVRFDKYDSKYYLV